MPNWSSYQNPAARAFRAPDAPALATRALQKSTVVATELRCDEPNFGRTVPMPREDAYLVALQLRECHDHDLYFEGRRVQPKNYFAGVTSIYDLREDPVAELRDPFHCIMLHVPRKALHPSAWEAKRSGTGELRYQRGVSVDDPVVHHLVSSLVPAIAKPEEAPSLFLDHVALALTAHLACSYGEARFGTELPRGGLAPWQEKRAKELMSASLNEDVPLARLANECGLSVRHFSRAFRQSTGTSPHRWLLKRRVENARELLSNRGLSLSEVALSCGFADQSHLTRVFTAMVGVSPGAWRRVKGPSERC